MVLGSPPTTLKPPILQGWVLRRVYDGAALIEGRDGIIEVEPGIGRAGTRARRGHQAAGRPLGHDDVARACGRPLTRTIDAAAEA